jgi:multiple sugar transport system substrate-binding protein
VVGGSSYGLPFAGDALMLVYRPSIVGEPPATWTDLIRRGEPVAFPAADPQSLLSLSIYLSSGGELDSTQRITQLDQEKLNQLFQLYADGAQAGVFPLWLTELQKATEAWTAYNELRSNWVITWMTKHLSDPADDSSLASFPSVNGSTTPLADGWIWSLTDPDEQVHPIAVELAEFLTDVDYLSEWTPLEGVLPVRPTSLSAYTDPDLQSLLGQEALTAHIRPSNEIVSSLGLVMEEQLVQILSGKTTAPFAAQAIMDRFGSQ